MSLSLTGLSGDSWQLIDSGNYQAVTDVEVIVTAAAPQTRVIGVTDPLTVWRVGQVFLGYSGGGPPNGIRVWGFYVHWMHLDEYVPAFKVGSVYFDAVWWSLAPGVTIDLNVYW